MLALKLGNMLGNLNWRLDDDVEGIAVGLDVVGVFVGSCDEGIVIAQVSSDAVGDTVGFATRNW